MEEDEAAQAAAPITTIRLYLRAHNLPKSIVNQQPDTLARISRWPPQPQTNGTDSHHVPPNLPPTPADIIDSVGGEATSHFDIDATTAGEIGAQASATTTPHEFQAINSPNNPSPESSQHHQILDETEIVYKSSNPRYTASFTAEYEYGSQLLFFVDLFAVNISSTKNGNKRSSSIVSASMGKFVKKNEMRFLGRAVFDVQDVLGSKNNIKARRLRKGGVVYAHIEQQSAVDQTTTARSLSTPNRMLSLRLRADSLKHVNSVKSKVVSSKFISKPDTYFEISRPSTGSWIVVYRSPTVNESVSPAWDEAQIDLSSFYTRERVSGVVLTPDSPLDAFRLRIAVFKVKKRKCKEIGSFETTIESLVEACRTTAKVTGYEDENSVQTKQSTDEGEHPVDEKVFHLHPRPYLGVDRSDKIAGNISILKASIGNPEESGKLSQRFLSGDDDDDNTSTAGRSLCSMNDDDSNTTRGIHQVLAHQPRPKFADYVRSGILDIDFCVAIDFTSSNGDPRVPGTHHYSRDGMMNDYEEAIAALGSTIQKYSTTQKYPVWGFGAKFDGEVRHVFQCGTDNAEWTGTDGILDAYRTVFETDLIMSGPTVIEKVLKQAAGRAKKCYKRLSPDTNMCQPGCKYCVLLILTDGIVNDLQSTKELIRQYQDLQLPLSVVVVGIGRADFSEFHQWNQAPSNSRGRFRFVEFREHQFDPDTLSMKALEHVPQEVVNYFLHRNTLPQL